MMSSSYSFLIVDDHPLFSLGLSSVLKSVFPSARIDCCESTFEAESKLKHEYDIVFVDQRLRAGNQGLAYIEYRLSIDDSHKFVLITGELDRQIILKAKVLGISGALSKSLSKSHIETACHDILAGGNFFDKYGLNEHICTIPINKDENQVYCLTNKEIVVLGHLKSGDLNKQLAEKLNITENTLRAHLRNIFKKMNVSNRTECVSKAIGSGII